MAFVYSASSARPRLGLGHRLVQPERPIAAVRLHRYGLAMFGTILLDYWFEYYARTDDWFGASPNFSIYMLYAVCMMAAVLINLLRHQDHGRLNMISA